MGKNIKKNTNTPKSVAQKNDELDVKQNLKKLRSGNGNSGFTNEQYVSKKNDGRFYNSSEHDAPINHTLTSTNHTEKVDASILDLHKNLNEHKEKINDKIGSLSSDVNKNISENIDKIESKLEGKLDKSLFFMAISVLVVIALIIYNLSYSELLKDVGSIKENKNNVSSTKDNVAIPVPIGQKENVVPKIDDNKSKIPIDNNKP